MPDEIQNSIFSSSLLKKRSRGAFGTEAKTCLYLAIIRNPPTSCELFPTGAEKKSTTLSRNSAPGENIPFPKSVICH